MSSSVTWAMGGSEPHMSGWLHMGHNG